jgi:hypothetical protein
MMKNNVNKNGSAMKKLIPAAGMLAVSAMMLATSTYAWFSMNTQVTATGMQVKAQAEGGIVISNESGSDWKASTTASHNSVAELAPISTANFTNWYHAKSDDANSAKAGQAASNYSNYSSTMKVADGIGYNDVNSNNEKDNDEIAHYLLNKFYIKSSAEEIKNATLKINKVTATGASTSGELDKSLRIGINIGGTNYIYAPVDGATLSYTVAGTTNTTATSSSGTGIVNTPASGVAKIPDNAAVINQSADKKAIEVLVYIYFEGEDLNCKSNNITTTLDTLQVEVTFGTTDMTNA